MTNISEASFISQEGSKIEALHDTERERDYSVIYRTSPVRLEDYDEAINSLVEARRQLFEVQQGMRQEACRVCEDTGHTAEGCHHNPLLMARFGARTSSVFRCYHCGFVAESDEAARAHFGSSEDEVAACIKTQAARPE